MTTPYNGRPEEYCKNTTSGLDHNTNELQGVLKLNHAKDKYQLRRYFPGDALKHLVEQYWLVAWDLPQGEEHAQQNLPDPNCHLVIEGKHSYIQGVVSQKFSYNMKGRGQIIGVKFTAGALNPWVTRPAQEWLDTTIDATQIFGDTLNAMVARLQAATSDQQIVAQLEQFLLPFAYPPDTPHRNINRLLQLIKTTDTINTVEQLAQQANMSVRSIQRLFSQQIGLSPKWIIRKYRLHQALKDLEQQDCDILDVVERLDYTDQAHLIRDFKAMIGMTPGKYLSS